MPTLDPPTRTELEAAAFRTLVAHLRERTDVQNIDLMNLAGFCRNCLAKWYRAAAEERGQAMSYDARPRARLRHAVRGVARPLPDRGVRRGQGRASSARTADAHGAEIAQNVRILTFDDRSDRSNCVHCSWRTLDGCEPKSRYLRPRPAVYEADQASSWKTGGPTAARLASWSCATTRHRAVIEGC